MWRHPVIDRGKLALLEAIFPIKCGICGLLSPCAICVECSEGFDVTQHAEEVGVAGIDRIYQAFVYEGAPAYVIRRLKYDRVTSLAAPMSATLRSVCDRFEIAYDYLVPVPIHWRRYAMRGFNQSDLLVESFPPRKVLLQSLRRIRFTKPQVQTAPEQRLTNLHGAFRATSNFDRKHVLLVDDVMTSGGTAIACSEALRAAGAESVKLLVYARSRAAATIPE